MKMKECQNCMCKDCDKHPECIQIPEKLYKKLNGELPIKSNTKLARFLQQITNKKTLSTEPSYNVSFRELLERIILNPSVNIKEFLLDKNSNVRGNLYQALWLVLIVLDRIEPFTSKNFDIIDGKIESESDMLTPNYLDKGVFFQTLFNAGNKSGISDLTFKFKKTKDETNKWACEMDIPFQDERYVLCTFKFYEKEKGVNHYDIQDIVEGIEAYKNKYDPLGEKIKYNIVMFIHNRAEFVKKQMATGKKHFNEDVGRFLLNEESNVWVETIYDLDDLLKHIHDLREANIKDNVESIIINSKQNLSLSARFHQLLFVKKTVDMILDKNEKLFVWGQIARSGKTYTAGLLVSKLYKEGFFQRICIKNKRPSVVLVITPAPSETLEQFHDELFKMFKQDFGGFNVRLFDGNTKAKIENEIDKDNKPWILITSKQFLHSGIDEEKSDVTGRDAYLDKVRKVVENNMSCLLNGEGSKVDLIIYDEVHYGGSTDISQLILNVLDRKFKRDTEPVSDGDVVKVFLTATYKRPVDLFKVKDHQLMTWGIDDIELAKYITNQSSYDKMCERFGTHYVSSTIKELRSETILSSTEFLNYLQRLYQNFPTLVVLSAVQDVDWIQQEMKFNVNEYSAEYHRLFALQDNNKTKFVNETDLINLLKYIGDDKKKFSICRRIDKLFSDYHQNRPFRSYLWFIPYFDGSKIVDVSASLQTLMQTDKELFEIYKHYNIVIAGDKIGKREVKTSQVSALRQQKKGVIILAGKKFSLGVSFPCVDAVFFLNKDKDVDIIYQRMFRALTESKNKKLGIVVDLNPYRTIQTLATYALPPHIDKKLTSKTDDIGVVMKGFEYFYKNRSILFDNDKLTLTTDNSDVYKRLYSIIEATIRKEYGSNDVDKIKIDVQKKLGTAFTNFNKEFLVNFFAAKNKEKEVIDLLAPENKLPEGKKTKKSKKKNPNNEPKKKPITDSDIENIRQSLIQLYSDLVIIIPLLLKDENTNLQHKSFIQILKKICKTAVLIDDCNKTEDVVDDTNEHRLLMVFYNILLSKFRLIVKKEAYDDLCDLFIDFFTHSLKELEENNLFTYLNNQYNIMKETINVKSGDINTIYEYIEKFLPPKEVESKLYGEVFTPLSLVDEMLTAVETYGDKNIWKNPKIKILDPAVGIGQFPIVAYKKLMNGLETVIKNEEARRKHILENMLYMVELNSTNVKLLKKVFGAYNINILNTDFLVESVQDINNNQELTSRQRNDGRTLLQWKKTLSFDLIIGNPPYQKQVGPNNTATLWDKFVLEVLPITMSGGYITFVHPSGWRDISGSFKIVQKEILKRNLKYLEIHNEKDGIKTFRKETRYDWYVLQNKVSNSQTIIKFQDGIDSKLNISNMEFIPNGQIQKIQLLLAKQGDTPCHVLYDTKYHTQRTDVVSKTKTDKYKYPCVYTVNAKDELSLYWASEKKTHFGVPKLIWSNGRIISVGSFVDDKGEYGMTQFAYAIVDDPKVLPSIKKAFDSDEFRSLMEQCAVGQLTISHKIVGLFKKDFWKHFVKKSANIKKDNGKP